MYRKRRTAVFLAGVLLAGMLSGCAGPAGGGTPGQVEGESSGEQAATGTDASGETVKTPRIQMERAA